MFVLLRNVKIDDLLEDLTWVVRESPLQNSLQPFMLVTNRLPVLSEFSNLPILLLDKHHPLNYL